MNKNIEQLYRIAQKPTRTILGLMSGTSLDGLDMALCEVSNAGFQTQLQLKAYHSEPYDDDFKKAVKEIFSTRDVDLQQITLMHAYIAEVHARIINSQLKAWGLPQKPDIIASHGQSIYHAPKSLHPLDGYGNATLQITDGDHLSVRTGIICISDFRQKHVAAGAEGAPLAAYGDMILCREDDTDIIMLNIGGISNFSFIPASGQQSFSTDVGPGNGLMDAWMQKNFTGKYFDKDAQLARAGNVNPSLLNEMKKEPFFSLPFPKTTGPELFNLAFLQRMQIASGTQNISVEDVMATLNRLTAETIVDAINTNIKHNIHTQVYVSGGGYHNPMLMEYISKNIQAAVHSSAKKNIDPDAKEAILFAVLANECLAGDPQIFANAGKSFPPISMGKISFPT